ncbi:MAG: PadR family transcriptional regulator [Candidatus Thermoplasmatota archaeon]|nr:PadR family transcriptional regulator [Candidatus Thermoplasmatota archaeon]
MAGEAKVKHDEKFEKELITGLISLVLLAITRNKGEPMYGYQIAKHMETGNRTHVQLKQGTIYPVLRAMEKKGYLKSEIKASGSGPPRKYYMITKKGSDKLEVWIAAWEDTSNFVNSVLGGDVDG